MAHAVHPRQHGKQAHRQEARLYERWTRARERSYLAVAGEPVPAPHSQRCPCEACRAARSPRP